MTTPVRGSGAKGGRRPYYLALESAVNNVLGDLHHFVVLASEVANLLAPYGTYG